MALFMNSRDADGTHRISGSSSRPISMTAYLNFDAEGFSGNKIPYKGRPELTDLNSIQAVLNGVVLEPSEYSIDLDNRVVVLRNNIVSTDTDFELRSMVSNAPNTVIDDILILPVSKHVTADILKNFIPNFGEEVSVERIESYPQNEQALYRIGMANLAEVLSSTIKEDGLYAKVKFSIQQ